MYLKALNPINTKPMNGYVNYDTMKSTWKYGPPKLPKDMDLPPNWVGYDPRTGVFIPRKRPPPPPCRHSRKDSYLKPCRICHKYCNCDWTEKENWPDVLVCSVDFQTVRLASCVVRGSLKLQRMVRDRRVQDKKDRFKMQEMKKSAEQRLEDSGFFDDFGEKFIDLCSSDDEYYMNGKIKMQQEVIIIDDDEEEAESSNVTMDVIDVYSDSEEETPNQKRSRAYSEIIDISSDDDDDDSKTAVLDILEFKQPEIMDLRKGENTPTFGILAKTFQIVQRYMSLHLEHVENVTRADIRAERFFDTSLFPRPKDPPIDPWRVEDWEEELFDVDFDKFQYLLQAKHELEMKDLHFAFEKWLAIYRGIPQQEGDSNERVSSDEDDEDLITIEDKTELEKYCTDAPRSVWKKGFHKNIPCRSIKNWKNMTADCAKVWRKRIWRKY